MASDDSRRRVAEVMEMVANDMETDAKALDGKPFDGKTVAVALGNLCAGVQACAKAIAILAAPD